jgi:hypothetical protein
MICRPEDVVTGLAADWAEAGLTAAPGTEGPNTRNAAIRAAHGIEGIGNLSLATSYIED